MSMEITEITSATENDDFQAMLLTLPSEQHSDGSLLHLYKGTWYPAYLFAGEVSFQRKFVARDTDIILVSVPKSGTTWLKALTYSIVNRSIYDPKQSPLLVTSPHVLVPFTFEFYQTDSQYSSIEYIPEPRICCCHSHYTSLPQSIRDSSCKIVYICRNPLDQLVSYIRFVGKLSGGENNIIPVLSVEEGLEKACRGVQLFGPFWDSVLGYWKASLEMPDKVLFLKYEDLKEDIHFNLKRLAEFLGFPFSEKEEKEGVVEEISRLCSLENLKNLEVHKTGVAYPGIPNSAFFGKGEVGDGANYVTPSMAESYLNIVEKMLAGSGLTFKASQ